MAWFSGNESTDPGLEARVRNLEQQVAELRQLVAALQAGQPGSTGWEQPQASGYPPVPQQQAPGQPGWATQGGAPGWDAHARATAASGKKIEAIRQVREATGWGLKEAKDYVERF